VREREKRCQVDELELEEIVKGIGIGLWLWLGARYVFLSNSRLTGSP
jgi:hypothetical protein